MTIGVVLVACCAARVAAVPLGAKSASSRNGMLGRKAGAAVTGTLNA